MAFVFIFVYHISEKKQFIVQYLDIFGKLKIDEEEKKKLIQFNILTGLLMFIFL